MRSRLERRCLDFWVCRCRSRRRRLSKVAKGWSGSDGDWTEVEGGGCCRGGSKRQEVSGGSLSEGVAKAERKKILMTRSSKGSASEVD